MINKLKKSKAGFTLVELIVVIAIIGVLAAVLAPQYIKYVETSREGVDRNTLGEIYHAAEISASSEETLAEGAVLTIEITKSSGAVEFGGTLASKVKAICPESSCTMKSKSGKGSSDTTTYTINYKVAEGIGWNSAVPTVGGATEKVAGKVVAGS